MRNVIVDAAEKVFSSKPFSKVSMRDIAKEAGISPALIYDHFPDQQHLFMEAFLRGAAHLLDQFAGHIMARMFLLAINSTNEDVFS